MLVHSISSNSFLCAWGQRSQSAVVQCVCSSSRAATSSWTWTPPSLMLMLFDVSPPPHSATVKQSASLTLTMHRVFLGVCLCVFGILNTGFSFRSFLLTVFVKSCLTDACKSKWYFSCSLLFFYSFNRKCLINRFSAQLHKFFTNAFI